MFDIFFPLKGGSDGIVGLGIDKVFKVILFAEAIDHTFPMLPNPAGQVFGNANIEGAVWLSGHDVCPGIYRGTERISIMRCTP